MTDQTTDQTREKIATREVTEPKPRRRAGANRRARTTKRAQLIRMLQGRAGADVAAISAKLGWQAHTTRAALSGLRKAGYAISGEKGEGGQPTRYRITTEPVTPEVE
jgi:hypothetical protein